MKATQIEYKKRFNVGPYEHEEMAIQAILDESGDENPAECLVELKEFVAKAHGQESLGSNATAASTDKPPKGKDAKAGKADGKEAKGKTAKGKEKKDDDNDSEEVEEEIEETEEETEADEGTEEEAEEVEDPPPAKGKKAAKTEATPGKKFKSKGTKYSRANDTHKKILSDKLGELFKGWSKNEKTKEKAKSLSKKLEGVDFLDADGQMLPSFLAEIKKGMR